jgi:hypothetical protein
MRTLLRSLIWLGLVIWIGGLIFFGAVVAPLAFYSVMPMVPDPVLGLHVAGAIVRGSLVRIHDIGLVCGIVLLLLAILERLAGMTRRSILPHLVLLAVMLGLTAYSQFSIIPRMDSLRVQAGPAMENPQATNPAKAEFNRLHQHSTALEEIVLVCGLGLIVLYARPEAVRAA